MKKILLLVLLLSCSTIFAAPANSTHDWRGFYLGANAGTAFSDFNNITSTQANTVLDAIQASTVNSAGSQTLKTVGFLTGIEGGYNWQFKRMLLGLEAGIQSLSTSGAVYSDSIPFPNNQGFRFVVTSLSSNNWLFTLRPQLGVIESNWLFYVTGGLGLALLQNDFLFTFNDQSTKSQQVNTVKSGYIVGTGVQAALTKHINFKIEYLFGYFNTTKAFLMNSDLGGIQPFTDTTNLTSNMLLLGLNYQFNNQIPGSSITPLLTPAIFAANQWEILFGTRFFLSSGLDGSAQPLLNFSGLGKRLSSRLIFSKLLAISGETFARIDHASGLYTQGYLGAGTITQGKLHDEDFPSGDAYSNTISSIHGNLSYATADVGYSFLKKPFAKTGVFIGYNYYAQNLRAYNCDQLAAGDACQPHGFAQKFIVINENDYLNSLRVGLSSQFNLTSQFTVLAEAAFLPVVSFRGIDMHNARQLYSPQYAKHGDGSMLEMILLYQLNNSWDLGLGGRYWMWNTENGLTFFNFLGGSQDAGAPVRFKTARYGVFLQLNYHYKKTNPIKLPAMHGDWKGIYLGAHLGGGWGSSTWSDPFGSTVSDLGGTNVAGFGDKINSTGPLGGVTLNANWQSNRVVYGASFNLSTAGILGEDTLFSGIGGINGKIVTTYLGTITGKIGVAANRSLVYLCAGGAVLNNKDNLNANTNALTLGEETQATTNWGWTSGAGLEYKITSHWSSSIEYDYIHLRAQVVSFPSIATINQQRITASQSLSLFKLGINYRLGTVS